MRVQLSPRTSGRIEYLVVREGEPVKAGQVLARIDPTLAQAAVLQAQASVAAARSRLAEARLQAGPTAANVGGQIAQQRAGLASARADLDRLRKSADAEVASAESDLTNAEARVRAAEAEVTNAQAQRAREDASLANARTRLARVQDLHRQGYIAAQDVDDARTAVDVQAQSVQVAAAGVEAARQALASAQAQQRSAENQLAIARRRVQAEITSAEARVTQAEASLTVAEANRAQNPAFRENLAALTAAVRAAEAQLAQARSNLAETTLRSSIDGTVTARNADPGSLASPGQPILTVQSLDSLFVTSAFPLAASGQVRAGTPVEVRLDAVPDRVFRGKVNAVNPAADETSRRFNVRIVLPNPDGVLKPGMFGQVRIVTRSVEGLLVPREAIQGEDDSAHVFVVGDDSKAAKRAVELGMDDGRRVQVVQGLNPGEKVVILSYQPLRDGQTVRLPGARPAAAGPRGSR